jgi:hypothetical protein
MLDSHIGCDLDRFSFIGENGLISIVINEVSEYPQYDCTDLNCTIEIKASDYFVKGSIRFDIKELKFLLNQLQTCYEKVSGVAELSDEVGTYFNIKVLFENGGHVRITGLYKAKAYEANRLEFDIVTDQSYISSTILEMKSIINRYARI